MKADRIITGDCLRVMKGIPDNIIDLTVTSPPYDNLRKYNGFTFDFEPIARELYRVTKQGGVVVWVVGDATINGERTMFRNLPDCIEALINQANKPKEEHGNG